MNNTTINRDPIEMPIPTVVGYVTQVGHVANINGFEVFVHVNHSKDGEKTLTVSDLITGVAIHNRNIGGELLEKVKEKEAYFEYMRKLLNDVAVYIKRDGQDNVRRMIEKVFKEWTE